MLINIALGSLIFGYAFYMLYRFIKKSKEGVCASCSSKKSCNTGCQTVQNISFYKEYRKDHPISK